MSIFNDDNKQKGNWWKPKQIGDLIEGTLVGRRQVPNNLQGGEQIAYDIKVNGKVISEGKETIPTPNEIWTVFGKPGIDAQTRYVKPGQVIGFKFAEKRPATRPGMNDTHVIQVFANPDIVDEEWMKQSEEEKQAAMDEGNSASQTPQEVAAATEIAPAPQATDSLLEDINKLASEKLGTKTPEEMKTKVMEVTKLAFIENNLPQIKIALEQLPAKA